MAEVASQAASRDEARSDRNNSTRRGSPTVHASHGAPHHHVIHTSGPGHPAPDRALTEGLSRDVRLNQAFLGLIAALLVSAASASGAIITVGSDLKADATV